MIVLKTTKVRELLNLIIYRRGGLLVTCKAAPKRNINERGVEWSTEKNYAHLQQLVHCKSTRRGVMDRTLLDL